MVDWSYLQYQSRIHSKKLLVRNLVANITDDFLTVFNWSDYKIMPWQTWCWFFKSYIEMIWPRFFFSFFKYSKFIPVQVNGWSDNRKTFSGLCVETKIQVCIPFLFRNKGYYYRIILIVTIKKCHPIVIA